MKPGIWDREINSFQKIDSRIDGILIIDLTLDNLYFIKELITKNKYYNPENMLCRRQNAVYQFQLGYSKRIIELLDAVIDYENVKVVHSDGSLEEMNSIIRKNSIIMTI